MTLPKVCVLSLVATALEATTPIRLTRRYIYCGLVNAGSCRDEKHHVGSAGSGYLRPPTSSM